MCLQMEEMFLGVVHVLVVHSDLLGRRRIVWACVSERRELMLPQTLNMTNSTELFGYLR